MFTVTLTSLFAVFLTYLSKYKKYGNLYKVAFIIITIIACIHYNFGTDYDNYYDIYSDISNFYSLDDISFSDGMFIEPGWTFLNIIFSSFGDPLGFIILVAFLNILQNYIYYKFIKIYVNPDNRWFAMSIYLFSSTFYILNFSMMRQGFAVSLIIGAAMLFLKNKYIWSFCLVLFAFLVHKSALIFLPFLPLGLSKFKNRKILNIVLWSSVIVVFVFSTFTSTLYSTIITTQTFEDYQGYDDFGTTSIGIGFFINLIPYLIISYSLLRQKGELSSPIVFMSVLMFVTLILIAFTLNNTLIGRLLYYFSVFSIVVVPNLYYRLKNPVVRYAMVGIYIFMLVWGYSDFFTPNNWAYEDYKTFHTIFEIF